MTNEEMQKQVQWIRNSGSWHDGVPAKDPSKWDKACPSCGAGHFSTKEFEAVFGMPVVTEWLNDGRGGATPLRSTVREMFDSGATHEQIADALERQFILPIPKDTSNLKKVTGRYSKEARKGAFTPSGKHMMLDPAA